MKYVIVLAILVGVYVKWGDEIWARINPSVAAVRAYERYADALVVQDWGEARQWSAGTARATMETAKLIYLDSSEPLGHEIRSKRVDGARVELETLQRTRYHSRLIGSDIPRNFVHEVKLEKQSDGWKVVFMHSQELKKDGSLVAANQFGLINMKASESVRSLQRAAERAIRY